MVLDKAFLLKFAKFGAVGFTGVFVDFGFTYLFKEIFKVQKFIANAIGFTIAATTNYFLNRLWTFHSSNPEVLREYSEFIVISMVGLGINSAVLWFLTSKFKWNFYFSKLIAIGVTTVWNFFANYFYTFSQL